MSETKKRFYVGVKSCGCITAALVEGASESQLALFASQMRTSGRRPEWRDLTKRQFMATFDPCQCEAGS